ncbi:MAG TPA: AmmeMemoRadiSam system protein B [Vicinamibacterales bacterium]|nr:AmmeMemoRadiSam system protein B [Vicinamibacterales bacterium]
MNRRAAVAGTWYSDNPSRLTDEIDRYLDRADVPSATGRARALIAPHAGLMYSGPVAAFAYKLLARRSRLPHTHRERGSYGAVVLVGPSHFVPFRGVSIWNSGAWETPLGPIAVERQLAETIRAESEAIVELPAAHGREHSLEMQLPFIARLLPGVPIVPLVMGDQTRETAFELADALARAIRRFRNDSNVPNDSNDSNVLLIASSDLSHYYDADVAARMDAVMIRHIEALDPGGLMTALEEEPRHACGGGPMVSVLHAARQLGATEAHVLRYADSGDVSGDKSSVVGYLAAAVL